MSRPGRGRKAPHAAKRTRASPGVARSARDADGTRRARARYAARQYQKLTNASSRSARGGASAAGRAPRRERSTSS